MNGVVSQFHKAYPAYAKTKVNVVYVPWTNATTEFTNALSSGKNAPDVTEIGNTETPTNASLGMLANITSNVNAWSTWAPAELAAVRGRPVLRRPLPHNKVSPAKYIGQTELGNPGATSGGTNEDFALGKLDMYIDGLWDEAALDR